MGVKLMFASGARVLIMISNVCDRRLCMKSFCRMKASLEDLPWHITLMLETLTPESSQCKRYLPWFPNRFQLLVLVPFCLSLYVWSLSRLRKCRQVLLSGRFRCFRSVIASRYAGPCLDFTFLSLVHSLCWPNASSELHQRHLTSLRQLTLSTPAKLMFTP